jgi:hypothetical protein
MKSESVFIYYLRNRSDIDEETLIRRARELTEKIKKVSQASRTAN